MLGQQLLCLKEPELIAVLGTLHSQNQEQAHTLQARCKNLSMEGRPAATQKQSLHTLGCTMQTESMPNVC